MFIWKLDMIKNYGIIIFCFNPLSPSIHIQILQTDLDTFL